MCFERQHKKRKRKKNDNFKPHVWQKPLSEAAPNNQIKHDFAARDFEHAQVPAAAFACA